MGSPHKMPGVLGRWWRWLTNPDPCPGEMWTLPSLGAVEILKVDSEGKVEFLTRGGHTRVWRANRFAERALFGAPSATQMLGVEVAQ